MLFPDPIAIEPLNVPLVALTSPVTIAPVAVINPAVETVKLPEPMFILPAVIEPRSADIADRLVTLISLAVITSACTSPRPTGASPTVKVKVAAEDSVPKVFKEVMLAT